MNSLRIRCLKEMAAEQSRLDRQRASKRIPYRQMCGRVKAAYLMLWGFHYLAWIGIPATAIIGGLLCDAFDVANRLPLLYLILGFLFLNTWGRALPFLMLKEAELDLFEEPGDRCDDDPLGRALGF